MMKKALVCIFMLVLATGCLIGPVAAFPAMACGTGSGCCQNACSCAISNQAPGMAPMASVTAMATFDPTLMAQAAQLSVPPATPAFHPSTEASASDERSEKEKLYDVYSDYRL